MVTAVVQRIFQAAHTPCQQLAKHMSGIGISTDPCFWLSQAWPDETYLCLPFIAGRGRIHSDSGAAQHQNAAQCQHSSTGQLPGVCCQLQRQALTRGLHWPGRCQTGSQIL